ncbi:HEAT repeat domain-containing protein [Desulfosudis oleivorans]|uniref:SH3 type 3 domain protein n=1 Tax=Desulfosudis oleivorans (strain DSM 6200 / JCM 39069 / Hxd3) TaxID=96561 RepID=A8ZT61_DESOH|nr:HEAT repeat domain-containing protein [Desulfosudis oleivorans]ABW67744.1 SH3 type 3 domain protein [Desulfosudis oleivorans Hxd3]
MPWKTHTIVRGTIVIFGIVLAAWMLAACAPWYRSYDITSGEDLTKISAVPELRKALKDSKPDVRMAAATALGRIGPDARDALSDLVDVLGDNRHEVREASANAISSIIGTAPVSEADKNLMVQVQANRLASEDWAARVDAADQLAQMGPAGADAVPVLISTLSDETEWSYYWTRQYDKVRRAAANALGEMRSAATAASPALIKASKYQDPGVRLEAVRALGKIGTPSDSTVVKALTAALKDDDAGVRREAADALGAFEVYANNTVPNLVDALSDQDVDARRKAAQVLGRFGPKTDAAAEALVAALKDTDKAVRQTAARAIAEFGIDNKTAAATPLRPPVAAMAPEETAAVETTAQPETKIRSTVDLLNIRAMPSVNSRRVGKLLQNEIATVVETLVDWVKIEKPDGTTGYVFKEYTAMVHETGDASRVLQPESQKAQATVNMPMVPVVTAPVAVASASTVPKIRPIVDALEMRSEPFGSEQVGQLLRNEAAEVVESRAGWIKIKKADGTTGYVFKEYTESAP